MYEVHIAELESRMDNAESRYGPLRSTHEGLGVALEEWHELIEAVRSNRMDRIRCECYDLAAVLLRLVDATYDPECIARSMK